MSSHSIGLEFHMDTFFWHLQLAALGDLHWLLRLVTRPLLAVLDLVDDIVALKNLAEHDVAAIEPASDDGGDKELRAVGVLAAVGHAWKSG
jgi:hypothetical protein